MSGRHAYMPFGRFRGWRLSDLPDRYVKWLLTIDLREPLHTHVRAEAQQRQLEDRKGRIWVPSELHGDLRIVAQRLVDVGFKKLALELHPDRGGVTAEMAKLNRAAEVLRGMLR